jgi:hypothetical protein
MTFEPVFKMCDFLVGADNPTLEKTLVTKSEEATAVYFS